MTTEAENQAFTEVCKKFEEGNRQEALRDLRSLIARVQDPVDKSGFLYHEVITLLELGQIQLASKRLNELKRISSSAIGSPPDVAYADSRTSLAVLVSFSEAKVLIEQGYKQEALKLLDVVASRYPKQLGLEALREINGEVLLLRGILRADVDQWIESEPFLEAASPPDWLKSLRLYYLGHCYFKLDKLPQAIAKLREALDLGMASAWQSRAHYILGLIHFKLSEFQAAKEEFQQCLKTGDTAYLRTTKIWDWLESVSRRLGLDDDAERYRQLKISSSQHFN